MKDCASEIIDTYKHLDDDDFLNPMSPWYTASIIVSTNRERFTLTHTCAVRYALARGKIVYRWLAKYSKWAGAPPNPSPEVFKDPCFYEYFVEGADGFISSQICADLNLVNAIPVTYSSFTLETNEDHQFLETTLNNSLPGDIITLPNPPASINVKVHADGKDRSLFTDFHREYFALKSLVEGSMVIPINQGTRKIITGVLVHGGADFHPSKVDIQHYFPLELAFAITVNKAQGRAIDNVIVALSKRPVEIANMGMKEIYVALSRVRLKENIRLLLNGGNDLAKEMTLEYLNFLTKDPTVDAFFAGFRDGTETNWKHAEWSEDVAYSTFLKQT